MTINPREEGGGGGRVDDPKGVSSITLDKDKLFEGNFGSIKKK